MSDFNVEVCRVTSVEPHHNADALEIAVVNGCVVCPVKGEYKVGDLAVHIPVDSLVPLTDPRFSFLPKAHVKAKKLRGVVSYGFIIPAEPGWVEGQNVQAALNIEKYTPAAERMFTQGDCEPENGKMPHYDIEPLKKYHKCFMPGERVWISEKIHGVNARFMHDGERLYVGSHTRMKRKPIDRKCMWWDIAERYDLEVKLARVPGTVIYGEIFGQVQDLTYGRTGTELAIFDALDTTRINRPQWQNPLQLHQLCKELDLPVVPTIATGIWLGLDEPLVIDDINFPGYEVTPRQMCEGTSYLGGPLREGIVVKPFAERTDNHFGRIFFKMVGDGYALRK